MRVNHWRSNSSEVTDVTIKSSICCERLKSQSSNAPAVSKQPIPKNNKMKPGKKSSKKASPMPSKNQISHGVNNMSGFNAHFLIILREVAEGV